MGYTDRKNVLILLAILKRNDIKKVVVSPGTTNIAFVASVQQDSWFEVYSAAEERSAAYIACGIAAESGEPVVLSCTGATASRNYMPGLTEAYYRKLPVLAVTSISEDAFVGNNLPQIIDRSVIPKDIARLSVLLPDIHTETEEWKCNLNANRAVLELKTAGGGPVHIQLSTASSSDFSIKNLPDTRIIRKITQYEEFPSLKHKGNIAIRVGAHSVFTEREIQIVDKFCEKYDAIVLCDHSSNYKGKYRILEALIATQEQNDFKNLTIDLLIDIGEVTGNYYVLPIREVWRVSEDGELKDRYKKLTSVFAMKEELFFEQYSLMDEENNNNNILLNFYKNIYKKIYENIAELPFSNIWIAKILAKEIPNNTVLHLGILNSLRAWNFFEIPNSVSSSSNVGGFGIDGGVSTFLGASLVNKNKLYFCVIGDLAFFYDMNALGNRHLGRNLRLLLINNGKGTEFKNYNHPGAVFGERTEDYIAAGRHYGNQSTELVKHYAQDLGFKYITARTKNEFLTAYKEFVNPEIVDQSILFEVFTDSNSESDALQSIRNIEKGNLKYNAKKFIRGTLGEKNICRIKQILR